MTNIGELLIKCLLFFFSQLVMMLHDITSCDKISQAFSFHICSQWKQSTAGRQWRPCNKASYKLFTVQFVSMMLHDVTATYASLVPPRSSLQYCLLLASLFASQCANMEGEIASQASDITEHHNNNLGIKNPHKHCFEVLTTLLPLKSIISRRKPGRLRHRPLSDIIEHHNDKLSWNKSVTKSPRTGD